VLPPDAPDEDIIDHARERLTLNGKADRLETIRQEFAADIAALRDILVLLEEMKQP
jgi:hypothetical protein